MVSARTEVVAEEAPVGDGAAREALRERLLVLRAQLGAADALGELVERYDARLLFYLRRLVGRRAEAEDVRQEVWLTVVRKLGTLDDPGAFRAWLYRVARHRGLSALRIRRPEAGLDAEELDLVAGAPTETDDIGPEQAAAVRAGLDRLAAGQREILSLYYLGELSYAEIGEVLALPLGTVRSRLHYAKAALREQLRDMGPRVQGPGGSDGER